MKRTTQEINRAIHDLDFQLNKAFAKCKESAPLGYKFSTNLKSLKSNEKDLIDHYKKKGYVISPIAYNMFGDEIDGYVSVYEKENSI